MSIHKIITNAAAAELAGVGLPAIWRAQREGRVKIAAVLWLSGKQGDSDTARFLDFDSVLMAYELLPLSPASRELIDTWTWHAPTITSATGEQFLLLHTTASFLHTND